MLMFVMWSPAAAIDEEAKVLFSNKDVLKEACVSAEHKLEFRITTLRIVRRRHGFVHLVGKFVHPAQSDLGKGIAKRLGPGLSKLCSCSAEFTQPKVHLFWCCIR